MNEENPLEEAERHVLESADRIARQKELIVRIQRDGHHAMLPQAAETLQRLETSYSLVTEHLRIMQAWVPVEQPENPSAQSRTTTSSVATSIPRRDPGAEKGEPERGISWRARASCPHRGQAPFRGGSIGLSAPRGPHAP
jgi:hypothetical protein